MLPTVLILSAGKQERFPEGWPRKQLLQINGESFQSRQIKQLWKFEIEPIIVTVHQEIKDAAPCWLHPSHSETILFTLESTRAAWQEVTVVLLGDVWYDDEDLIAMLTCRDPLKFWTNGSEIFCMSFTSELWKPIRMAIDLCEEKPRKFASAPDRRLWHLYRALNGLNIHEHRVLENDTTRFTSFRTFDIDSSGQYEKMRAELTTHKI